MARLTPGARRALAADRRAQILRAAAQVFARQGYDGATVRRIARRAGLAEGTIYLYFPSKRDLLLATWEAVAVAPLLPLMRRARAAETDEQFVAAVVADRLEVFRRQAGLIRLVMQQADADPIMREAVRRRIRAVKALLRGHLRRRMAEGSFRRVALPVAMRLIAGMMLGTALLEAYDPEPLFGRYPVPAVAREAARLILHGLALDGAAGERRSAKEQRA